MTAPQTSGGGRRLGKTSAASADCTASRHGTASAYRYGCRCDDAREARERYRKTKHLLPPYLIPIAGTRRRLQALMAIGWSQQDLAERLGRGRHGSLGPLLWSEERLTCSRVVADRVVEVYEELWSTPGPSVVTRERALRRGWLPALALDDDLIDDPTYNPAMTAAPVVDPVAVERACNGDPVPLTRAERILAVHRLNSRGLSQLETARRLRIGPKQVARDLDLRNVA